MDDLTFDIGFGPVEADHDVMATGKVDLSVYSAPARFAAEREIFGRTWLNIAEASEISNAGDWIVREVKIRSASVLIVRGKDMQVRAFHNICAHRGMKLAWDDKGRGGKFSCPYHAWMYDSLGALTHIPDEGCFAHVDKQGSGLTPIRCDIWEGLIFINLDSGGAQSLNDFLGPVVARIKNLPFASYPYTARVSAMIETNWKLGMEAQCEAYHAGILHAKTIGRAVVSRANPFAHPIAIELLGAHRMSTTPRNPDFACPSNRRVQAFSMRHATQMTIGDTGTNGRPENSFLEHPDLNVTGANDWALDNYILYPHFILAMSMGGWWLHRFWPVSPDRTQWDIVWHFEKPVSLRNQFAMQAALAFNRDTLTEDNVALEQQQKIIRGGGKKVAQFGDMELLCKHLAAVSEAASQGVASRAIAAE